VTAFGPALERGRCICKPLLLPGRWSARHAPAWSPRRVAPALIAEVAMRW